MSHTHDDGEVIAVLPVMRDVLALERPTSAVELVAAAFVTRWELGLLWWQMNPPADVPAPRYIVE